MPSEKLILSLFADQKDFVSQFKNEFLNDFLDDYQESMMGSITIYTDGSAAPKNPGPGGWAFLLYGPKEKELLDVQWEVTGSVKESTNNRMELQAVIEALAWSQAWSPKILRIVHTDSEYVRLGITKWIHSWKTSGWKSATGQAVKNQDLWKLLDELNSLMNVDWKWVKAHVDNEYNNRVDFLAKSSALAQHQANQIRI